MISCKFRPSYLGEISRDRPTSFDYMVCTFKSVYETGVESKKLLQPEV